jgi:hypothetical protein
MKCSVPFAMTARRLAGDFIDRFSRTNRPYRRLPRNASGTLAGGWIDVAINNAGVAASNRVAKESKLRAGSKVNWRVGTNLLTLINPPPHAEPNQCMRKTYDNWFDASTKTLMGRFVTYGRAQKFLNLFVKYNFCAEKSGLGTAWGRTRWTLDYECALHAPIDMGVLQRLRCAWLRSKSWPLIRQILYSRSQLRAWSNLSQCEYWKILCLLRCMLNATSKQAKFCGNDAFGPFCDCDGSTEEIPQDEDEYRAAVLAVLAGCEESYPLISALDLEMRGLWMP